MSCKARSSSRQTTPGGIPRNSHTDLNLMAEPSQPSSFDEIQTQTDATAKTSRRLLPPMRRHTRRAQWSAKWDTTAGDFEPPRASMQCSTHFSHRGCGRQHASGNRSSNAAAPAACDGCGSPSRDGDDEWSEWSEDSPRQCCMTRRQQCAGLVVLLQLLPLLPPP